MPGTKRHQRHEGLTVTITTTTPVGNKTYNNDDESNKNNSNSYNSDNNYNSNSNQSDGKQGRTLRIPACSVMERVHARLVHRPQLRKLRPRRRNTTPPEVPNNL